MAVPKWARDLPFSQEYRARGITSNPSPYAALTEAAKRAQCDPCEQRADSETLRGGPTS